MVAGETGICGIGKSDMPSAANDESDGHGMGINVSTTLEAAGIIGLWCYDIERGLVVSDHAMAITYGVDPARAARGLPPSAFRQSIHADDLPIAVNALTGAIDDGCEYRIRYRLIDSDGSATFIEARGRPLVHDGRTISIMGANLNVTHLMDLQDDDPLGTLADIAVEAAGLAHSIGHPRISAASRMLLREVGSELAVRLIDRPEGSA